MIDILFDWLIKKSERLVDFLTDLIMKKHKEKKRQDAASQTVIDNPSDRFDDHPEN